MIKASLYKFVLGEPGEYTLEQRLIIASSASAVILSFTGMLINFYFNFSTPAFIIPIILLLASAIVYYFARFKDASNFLIVPITIAAGAGMSAVWVYGGGMDSPNILIFFTVLILALIINKKKDKIWVFTFYLLLMILLFLIQIFLPEIIVQYKSGHDRLLDNIFTVIYNSFLIFLIISFLHREYRFEHEDALVKGEKLKILNDRLTQFNITKDKFFSIIAHDLRNPIFNLSKLSELLYNDFDKMDEKEKRELAKSLKKSSQAIEKLLENLLLWSKTQQGKIEVNPISSDIARLININISIAELAASNKNITVQTGFAAENSACFDENLINTVIRNLLSNAVKFTQNFGTVIIRTENTPDNGFIKIIFEDSGVGMTAETISKLFKIESARTTPGTNSERGTGLGLILCKEFVEMNNGIIGVESEINKGSKFWFTLPKPKPTNVAY